jgi:hypothetical protein
MDLAMNMAIEGTVLTAVVAVVVSVVEVDDLAMGMKMEMEIGDGHGHGHGHGDGHGGWRCWRWCCSNFGLNLAIGKIDPKSMYLNIDDHASD